MSKKSRANAARQAEIRPVTRPTGPGARQAAEAVAVASQSVELARETLQTTVDTARAAGASWTLIAEHLGVSRQAARQRFGGA